MTVILRTFVIHSKRYPIGITRTCTSSANEIQHQADRVRLQRPTSWYDNEANVKRHYYYSIDTRGRVFLSSEKFRSVASALRDEAFLKQLFRLMRKNNTGNLVDEYPYISPCGKELNFLSPDDPISAFSFTSLDEKTRKLSFAGSGLFQQSFDPSLLSYSPSTGRVYHPILSTSCKYMNNELGLLHPTLCEEIVLHRLRQQSVGDDSSTVIEDVGGVTDINDCNRGQEQVEVKLNDEVDAVFHTEWDGVLYPLKLL